MVYGGDADVGIWSPFEILTPAVTMGEVNHHEFPWLIKMKWKGLEWIKDRWIEGIRVVEEPMAAAFLDTSFMLGAARGTQGRSFPGAMVLEFYQKPGEAFPRGAYVVAANGIILDVGEYPFNSYNLEQFKDIDIPGQFWGKATMEEGIALQPNPFRRPRVQ